MNKQDVTVRGISASSLLGVAFIVLKLCGVIRWSWLWVLAPFWIPFILGCIIVAVWVLCIR